MHLLKPLVVLLAVPLLLVASAGVAIAAPPRPADKEEGGPPWMADPAAALARAAAQGRPVLADVWAIWCVPCREMDKTTYRDEQVLSALTGFVPLKVDADVAKSFIDLYGIEAYPTVLILDGKGRELGRLTGFVDAKSMRTALDTVAAGYKAWLEDAGSNEPEALARSGRYLLAAGNPQDAARRLKKAVAKATAGERDALIVDLARAQATSGEVGAAAKTLAQVTTPGTAREVRASAYELLAMIEEERGHADAAQAARAKAAQAAGE